MSRTGLAYALSPIRAPDGVGSAANGKAEGCIRSLEPNAKGIHNVKLYDRVQNN
jgi:hypothetical protein